MQRYTRNPFVLETLSLALALATVEFLLSVLLGVQGLHTGWRHFLAWLIIFLTLNHSFRGLLKPFTQRVRRQMQPDLYSLAEA